MQATLTLIACALATAQAPADPADWALQPHLTRGLELVYRGTFTEEAKGQGVQFSRTYRMEARAFVLDVVPERADVAFLTTWKGRPSGPGGKPEPEVSSVRLEVVKLDLQGKIKPGPNTNLAPELDGPPSIECGAFVEVPKGRLQTEQKWDVADGNRPARTWRVVGADAIAGTRCVKLVGEQRSDDWDHPRADRAAWRRQDTVWMTPKTGYAARVERIIERREPARKEANQRFVLRYELESNLTYPAQLFEDRRREITLAQSLFDNVTGLLPRAGQLGPRPFENVLKRIEYHSEQYPPTPYRDALRRVQRLAEAGKRGESPPEVTPAADPAPVSNVLALGRPAPDFLVPDLLNSSSVRLRHWIGRPILLVFYNPLSSSAPEVLHFAQRVLEGNSDQVVVLGMAVSDDTTLLTKQRAALRLTFPMLSGTGLRLSYAVDATPKLVVLDAAGVVRGSYVGWGPETPRCVTEDLKKCHGPGE